ncbi:hypothetical protein HPB49_016121 [Dermacentor silvarum]|uniref:Uncharacterized protein n=1 Tax=Dermacentor silvarum TaxID=543639 RepID=A0ACB8CYF0_DERSI|nr:hypothetical protein HPB49_016121 [Dermacentor silvarum]
MLQRSPRFSRHLQTLNDGAYGSGTCTERKNHLRRIVQVCELHFEPHCVVRDYVPIINGEEVRLPRGKPMLSSDAVPTILPNALAYLSKRVVPRMNERKRKAEEINRPAKKVLFSSAEDRQTVDEPTDVCETVCV